MPTVKHLIFVLNFYIKEEKNFREYLLRSAQLVKDSGISAIYKASRASSSLWINNYYLNFPSCSSILRLNIIQNFSFNFCKLFSLYLEVRMKSICQAKRHTCPGSTKAIQTKSWCHDVILFPPRRSQPALSFLGYLNITIKITNLWLDQLYSVLL